MKLQNSKSLFRDSEKVENRVAVRLQDDWYAGFYSTATTSQTLLALRYAGCIIEDLTQRLEFLEAKVAALNETQETTEEVVAEDTATKTPARRAKPAAKGNTDAVAE